VSFETALLARITASAAVTDTGASVDWSVRPQGKYPAVVLTIVGDRRGRTMTGFQGTRPVRVQIDVMALSRGERIALREAVIAATSEAATVGGVIFAGVRELTVRDFGEGRVSESDGSARVFRDVIDGVWWHRMED
jgi:hypothetical protein